ncbi:cell division topological specificity factor MinE [Immundisolibacter sp.]|uniref:cell division topological specificity factor MinE n=1 Tax=Immundisolibacter sp. TaxID=1934948 RepID=UPI0019CC6B11|nr:cell division topological specificity factor MinE [Immundisolibacter sp.]MBC7163061.1 cell division topological specificity factor MinE [Immundisolibacter sp.]MEA3220629.1 Cell division topological specificity factor [Immundisolibacter sp.]
MRVLDFLRNGRNKGSASMAKERLQIVVAHQRREAGRPPYFASLQRDLLEVVRRYVTVDDSAVKVDVEHLGDCDILELNITLPDQPTAGARG